MFILVESLVQTRNCKQKANRDFEKLLQCQICIGTCIEEVVVMIYFKL